ncbi:hypothetical protein [uncultured Marixanthomonas sp.]|mgnify:CR=1 FL=1|uniref:hypothetical protein n=1 Tax=uncultured Marixanthomonas sp. TaxID=757245 RepID=UPI0030D73A7D|tara:strand:- start:61932 stop:62504 length:573 start_codon:yes stop_codon:yes gene_type:complete
MKQNNYLLLLLVFIASCQEMDKSNSAEASDKSTITTTQYDEEGNIRDIKYDDMTDEEYREYRLQIQEQNVLKQQIREAEKQITFSIYTYNVGGIKKVTVLLDQKNNKGEVLKRGSLAIPVKWEEKDCIITIAPIENHKTQYRKFKRIDYKTIQHLPNDSTEGKLFYGELGYQDNLKILNILEKMEAEVGS